jgi:hypothetical protein
MTSRSIGTQTSTQTTRPTPAMIEAERIRRLGTIPTQAMLDVINRRSLMPSESGRLLGRYKRYSPKYDIYRTQISDKDTGNVLYYYNLLISQGWKPDHLKNLSLSEMKQLTCHGSELDLDTLLAFSDYQTLYNFASENYGLRNRRLSRNDLIYFITQASLARGEPFLVRGASAEENVAESAKIKGEITLPVTPVKIEQNDRDDEVITLTQAQLDELVGVQPSVLPTTPVAVNLPPPLPENPPVGSLRFGLF